MDNFNNQSYVPNTNLEEPMTVKEWFITILLTTAIPCVNIIMLFVWGFSSNVKKAKSNYCKAMLIWVAIAIVLSIIYWAVVGATIFSMFSNGMYY